MSLPIPYHEQERARNLVYGFNGDPASVAGNYWRMLYLSVVIITTLGLGDIIPLSSMARGLVGTEAVCGIMLMGLFLNAIAWRASLWRASLEQNVWRRTRRRVGMKIGWAHGELSTRFMAAAGDGSSEGQNFYEVLHQWAEDLLADIVNTKRDFSYAFTAEMADSLELYEQSVRQKGLSLRVRQFRNLNILVDTNESCIKFLKIVKLTEGDIRMLAWTVDDISRIKEALTASDLASAKLPPPPTSFSF